MDPDMSQRDSRPARSDTFSGTLDKLQSLQKYNGHGIYYSPRQLVPHSTLFVGINNSCRPISISVEKLESEDKKQLLCTSESVPGEHHPDRQACFVASHQYGGAHAGVIA
jgi:hypothetical protein